eukprot:comp19165_c0_seq1/m.35717 comp19165_c0_seq1/g.35717  ORF comp19165_c0_seq1/g.35717 comp19165_c0_seq1/m.35717 type:complete len:234 (+) comp19165_c0_seq1:76-777(+)
MNQNDVQDKIRQMASFIEQEAREKAEEIRQKADEDFSIESLRKIEEEKTKIRRDYEQKLKQVDVKRKIAQSNEINAARLRVLSEREAAVVSIFERAQERLPELSKDRAAYKAMVADLIVQSLINLQETNAIVKCRECDKDIVQEVLAGSVEQYQKLSGKKEVHVQMDSEHLAPPPSADNPNRFCNGGIVVHAHGGKIICDNTLDSRLRQVYEAELPEIRTALFGRSLTRAYKD